MIRTALILAGGKGERFWPKSRTSLPKQFLSLTTDNKTMIQLTAERINSLVEYDNIFVVTNEAYKDLVKEQLPEIPKENIICEPIGRNTAPCIGLGAFTIRKKYPEQEVTTIVLPSDHLVSQNIIFKNILNSACNMAEKDENFVTIGITPNYPETGYGYIKYAEEEVAQGIYPVEAFVEKPNLQNAKKYLNEGNYLWNSGIFIFSLTTFFNALKKYMPDTYNKLKSIYNVLGSNEACKVTEEVFPSIESESIDYGIMEKTKNIYIIPGNFGWDDVGSWLAVTRINKTDTDGNFFKGNVVATKTSNSLIESESGKLIAAVGLNNLIIVDSKDATLICDKNNANDIKELLAMIRDKGMDQYL